MNLATTALLVILSHAGYWVGGTDQAIELQWAVEDQMPAAVVRWNLSVASAALSNGEVALPAGDGKTTIAIRVPRVRQRVDALFRYQVVASDGGRAMLNGERAVHLFPDRIGDLAAMTRDKAMLIVDAPGGLPEMLRGSGAAFEQVESLTGLMTTSPPIVIVGQERLAADDPAAATLAALAKGGASVVVLRQMAVARVLQYPVTSRDASGFKVDADHPLMRHLTTDAWTTLLHGRQPALALDAGEPALELIYGPIEAETVRSAPVDALLLSCTMGEGRIVYCQLPVDAMRVDARQQQLFLNLIEYARTRAQPTPPRAARSTAPKAATDPIPAQEIYGK